MVVYRIFTRLTCFVGCFEYERQNSSLNESLGNFPLRFGRPVVQEGLEEQADVGSEGVSLRSGDLSWVGTHPCSGV